MKLTLDGKFIVLSSILILLGSSFLNTWIVSLQQEQLLSEAKRRALITTESTAISFTNTLLYEELGFVEEGGLLENNIQDLLTESGHAITGMTVYDKHGVVLASDDYTSYLDKIAEDQLSHWNHLSESQLIESIDKTSFEIIAPLHIRTKRFGTLLVQFTLKEEFAYLNSFKGQMMWLTVGFAVIGILIAYVVARTLAKPIKSLAGEMRRVQNPSYIANINSTRKDEIGELQRGFVDMLNRLRAADEEKERQQKNLIQAEKLASVGTLVSGLAHEINNPLAGVRSCLRRIMIRPENSKQTAKYAKLMDAALLRIETLVKDLLNFARKKELIPQPVNINNVIRAAYDLVELKIKKKQIKLKMDLSSKLPAINGDWQHLEQVFVNLLINAIDATGETGTIAIKTRNGNQQLEVEVVDSGNGIPADIQNKIFDPFFTTKPVGEGTGLGLSVTKAIIDQHKGNIEVTSDTKGTMFRLTFPVARDSEGTEYQVTTAILAGGKSRRMGENKALMQINGRPIIEHVVNAISAHTKDIMIISNQGELYEFLEVPIYPDKVKSCGPLAGIYTALYHADKQHCLVVACDMPFLSKSLVEYLTGHCADYDVLAFESEFGIEPLCAVYSKKCLDVIKTQIENGQFKVSDFYEKVNTRIVRLDPNLVRFVANSFFNINTREEFTKAHKFLELSSE